MVTPMDTTDRPDEGLPEIPRDGDAGDPDAVGEASEAATAAQRPALERWFDRWTGRSSGPPDPSVRVDGEVEGLPALRRATATVFPSGVIRTIAVRVALVRGTESAGRHRLVEVVLDAEGNPAALSLQDVLRADPLTDRRVEQALDTVDAWLDAHGYAGRDVTEVILDADGGHEVRIAFGVEVSPEDVAASPPHPSVHGARFHLTHCAPDLEALRDRLRRDRTPRLRRLLHRIRLAVTRSE